MRLWRNLHLFNGFCRNLYVFVYYRKTFRVFLLRGGVCSNEITLREVVIFG